MASTWCGEQSPVLSVTENELVFTFSSHGSSTQCCTQQGCHQPAAKVTREMSLGELAGEIELVTVSQGLIFLLVPASLGCHPAWIRPLFHALGKLPSFRALEKPSGASPGALSCAPAVPAPHRSPAPSGTVSPPSTSCPTCQWLSPAGSQGISAGRGIFSKEPNRASETGTLGKPGGVCGRSARGSVRERGFCRGESGSL